MSFTTRTSEQGYGMHFGRVQRAASRSLDPLDTRDGYAPVQAVGAQLYRSADSVMDALREAQKRAAIEAAIAEAKIRTIARDAAREVGDDNTAPAAAPSGFTTTHALLILAALAGLLYWKG